jgi:transcription initiation factor IIE alpha subunit
MTRLIDEDETFKVLSAYYKHRYYEQDEALLDALSRVPAAVPVKRGKWIEGKCNCCGEHAPYWSMATTYYKSNYCPNCGADMRGNETS